MRGRVSKVASLAIVSLFLVSMLPSAEANPMVPYCDVASLGGGSSQTAGLLVDPALCEAKTGRVFPEALADSDYLSPVGPRGFTGGSTGFATDYVSYFEFQAGLEYLADAYPDYIEVHEVAKSAGNNNLVGGPSQLPIYVLEITNEKSPIAREDKLNLLFMLSIHGNEKGGREGGFRVLEDLLRNIGFATETVQNGAGLPAPIEKPTGGTVETYHDYLDFMSIFLLFPNADGWACDEVDYGPPTGAFGGGGCAGLFARQNANGVDLNRQTPTIGWMRQGSNSHEAVKEPEAVGYLNWLVDQREAPHNLTWNYAIDIHGMRNHKNFGAIMLPAGSFTPQEMHRSLRLAETLKERWNADPHFTEWRTLFQAAETGWAISDPVRQPVAGQVPTVCSPVNLPFVPDCPISGSALASDDSPMTTASSSQFAEYYTVIDAIGYTDSGFSGDFFAQSTGLNAPGYDIELAYNHVTMGAQYEGPGALFNDYHVWMVRHIVKSFMDAAALDVKISYETGGLKTAYVPPTYIATNADDVDAQGRPALTPGGWAEENRNDDAWDYDAEQIFKARPARYWEDMVPFLCESCGTDQAVPGVLERRNAGQLTAAELDKFDTLVIPGTAINQFVDGVTGENKVASVAVDQAKIDAIKAWVEGGGTLVLTDAALKFFDLAGITENAVEVVPRYMGGIRMDLEHPLLEKVRGGVKQTYEPTPLGWGTSGAAPNWFIDADKFSALSGASIAGLECGGPRLSEYCDDRGVALGELALGAGKIHFIGALLPDPTEEFYHPYGLDHYATTFSGNQIMRNLLGWTEVFAAPPITFEGGKIIQTDNEPAGPGELGGEPTSSQRSTPGLGILAALAAVALALRRRV